MVCGGKNALQLHCVIVITTVRRFFSLSKPLHPIPHFICRGRIHLIHKNLNNNNNNNNNIINFYYFSGLLLLLLLLMKLGCHPVAVVILHVYKIRNRLLIDLSREGYMRSM